MILVICILLLLYLFSISTRRPKALPKSLSPNLYAHRGLHDNKNFPCENSLESFEKAAAQGYGMEFDLQYTRDNKIVVFHDGSLQRLCHVAKRIRDLSYEELQVYRLPCGGKIPLFSEVLELVGGRVPLIIEIKHYKDPVSLVKEAVDMLKSYAGDYCIESFHPAPLAWLRFHAPHVVRGQLASGKTSKEDAPFLQRVMLKYLIVNLFSAPHFVAYTSEYDSNLSMFLVKKLFRPLLACFTLTSQAQLDRAHAKGYTMPIFEGFLPDTGRILK